MDKETVLKAVEYVEHTAINATLKELGILSKVEVTDDEVKAEFAWPFPNIPIKDSLMGAVNYCRIIWLQILVYRKNYE